MATDGASRAACEHPLGVEAFAWSPDSTRIAYVARVPEEGRYGTGKDVPPEKEPRRITTFQYRTDNLGFTFDRRRHVFVVDALAEGRAGPGHPGRLRPRRPGLEPDGAAVAFVSARHETRDEDAVSDVFVAPAAGGDAVRVTATDLSVGRPAFSDGATIWFVASEPDLAGGPRAVVGAGRRVGQARAADRPGAVRPRPRLRRRDPALLVGEDAVTTISLTGGGAAAALPGRRRRAHRAARGRRTVHDYAEAGGWSRPWSATPLGRRGRWSGTGGADPDRLRAVPARRAASLRPMEELEATAPDGAGVHGWVVKPAGTGPFPVLMVHGGPFAHCGWTLFDEAQVYAGAGYAVVMGNPRGRPATASPTAAPSSATSATGTARTCSPCSTPPSRTRTWTATGPG